MKNKKRVPITITCSECKSEYHGSICPLCGCKSGTYKVADDSCCDCYAFSTDSMSYPNGKCGDEWVDHKTVCDKFISRDAMRAAEHKACMIEIFKL